MTPRADVLILGSGPSAAYAVLACQDAGVSCEVMSNRPPNVDQAGAFFLHWLPERLAAPVTRVQVWGTGTREGYLMKQWGPEWVDVPTSFPEAERVEAWHSSLALLPVWEGVPFRLCGKVHDSQLIFCSSTYRAVFHTFSSTMAGMKRKLVMFPTLSRQQGEVKDYGTNMVIYNGDLAEPHIRTTIAWGRLSIEFPRGTEQKVIKEYQASFTAPPELVMLRDINPLTKPVTPAEWVAPNVVPLGRFATWDRRMLSHHAYQRVRDVLSAIKGD